MLETKKEEPCPTVPAGQKLIVLTFGDGPRHSITIRLLDGLSEHGVKAIFLLIGARIENDGDMVRRIDEEGHRVSTHTFDHIELTGLNRIDFDAQVEATRALLKPALGHNDFPLCPPYGMPGKGVKTWAGCPTILRSADPKNWQDQNTDWVMWEVVAGAGDGGIVLMHDISPELVDAALQIVDQLHQQGCLPCTMDEFLVARGPLLEAGEVYWNAYL